MSRFSLLLCITSTFLFFSCREKKSIPPKFEPLSVQGSRCSELSGSDTSYQVFRETLNIWSQTFIQQHQITNTDKFYFSVPADTLGMYLSDPAGCGSNCYAGVKAYMGLDTLISTLSEVQYHLSLILVPYTTGGVDTLFPRAYGPFIKVDLGNTREFIDSIQAQEYINNWGELFQNVEEEIAVPIYSFVMPLSTLQFEISEATNPLYDGNVYILCGYHTISPGDTLYCIENSRGYQKYPDFWGYAVHALILSSRIQEGGVFMHSSDFLRPCPRFCGTTMFSLNF